jgi:hypothetical protein
MSRALILILSLKGLINVMNQSLDSTTKKLVMDQLVSS